MSSITQGRVSPIFYLGYDDEDDRVISFNSVGVASEYYYHTGLHFSYFYQEKWGEYIYSEIKAGPGIGVFYSEVGYRESTSDVGTSTSDTNIGPAFRLQWDIMQHAFIASESVFGIRGYLSAFLSFQTTSTFIFGLRF